MNSLRDRVRDAISGVLDFTTMAATRVIDEEVVAQIADAVFDAMGISESEQDLIAEKTPKK